MIDLPPIGSPGVYDVGVLNSFLQTVRSDKQQEVMVLIYNAIALHNLVDDFASSVAMLDHIDQFVLDERDVGKIETTKSLKCLAAWRDMSGREAAMTLYHFKETLEGLCRNAGRIGEINTDSSALRAARARFKSEFPDVDAVRHAMAHRAESTATLENLKANACSGFFQIARVKGRTLNVTRRKQNYSLEIDNDRRRVLAGIANDVLCAFRAIAGDLPRCHE
jgi:hypothetical protein